MACLEASGTRGGIMMLWDRLFLPHCRSLCTQLLCGKKTSMGKIGSIGGLIKGPWAICGDFNKARYASENKNCTWRTIGIREFSDLIEDLNLIDLQLANAKFTWFKGDNHQIASRIDRILYTTQRIMSDHFPVTLQGGSWKKNKSYFKFESWWLRTDGFTDRIRKWWDSFDYIGRPDYIPTSKLKALKHRLKEWNRSEQRSLGQQRKNVLEKLDVMENISTDRALTEDEATEKATLF
ncbi:hypothetical protein H5410_002203 [Solanum commersonii]|uniref:Non-LTR retroelement reverse transcriptase n=1 Tax=Solanum commersonii TaxID=4109 RepID=A0A9J6B181_SOLCO|nr:hypothetical protein H5410_002203 [Solanum commersonii]